MKGFKQMEELKRMLEAIHKENKDILTLLCSDDEECSVAKISDEVDDMYDELFYGKETNG